MARELGIVINTELRDVSNPYDIALLLGSLAYIKYRDDSALKNLILQDKEILVSTVKRATAKDAYNYRLGEFFAPLEEFVNNLADSKYRDILTAASSQTPQQLLGLAVQYVTSWSRGAAEATPANINKLLVGLADIQPNDRVLDPTMGLGSTLVAALEAEPTIQVVGQDVDPDIAMFGLLQLRLAGNEDATIYTADALTNPEFLTNGKFDRVVQEPPFGLRLRVDISDDEYGRYRFGIPGRTSGDLAFISNAVSSLKETGGKAVVVIPNGSLFRSGADRDIRAALLAHDFIETIIALPARMFTNSMIPTSIVVLNNHKEASQAGQVQFIKVGDDQLDVTRRERRLSSEAVTEILAAYHAKAEIEKFAVNIPVSDIKDSNLLVESYIIEDTYTIDGMQVKVDFDQLAAMDTTTLGEVATIARGFNMGRSVESETGAYRVIRITDLNDGGIDYAKSTRVELDGAKVDNYVVQRGDLLLSIRGTNTKIGMVDTDDDSLLFNANLVRLRSQPEWDPAWLQLYLNSPMAQVLMTQISKGTTIRQILIPDLKNIPIPRLTLAQQQAAVKAYQTAMATIREQQAELEAKEAATKRAFYDATMVSAAFEISNLDEK